MEFKQYIGLGDSISTDDYPGKGLGGISLFYKNDNRAHPSFKNKDLVSRFKSIELFSLAQDGTTSKRILERQMISLPQRDVPTLATITVGGNDILNSVSSKDFNDNLNEIIFQLNFKYSNLLILLGTIYDPSDLIGKLLRKDISRIYDLNRIIKGKKGYNNVVISDIHRHFLGHGLPFSWIPKNYWYCGLIEPNIIGGNEVRRVFLSSLEKYKNQYGKKI